MKMKAISLIILIMLGVGFLSGCTEDTDKPSCVVIRKKTAGYWSEEYNAFFVQVWVQNYGSKGNVHIGVEVTQDDQTFNYFWLNTVCAGCETVETIRCGDIKRYGGRVTYTGWVHNC